jgi:hypothetical protein
VSWTLPLYELALLTAAEIERCDLAVETTPWMAAHEPVAA